MNRAIFLNVVEIVNCCFFLRKVAKSPSFVVVPQQLLKICVVFQVSGPLHHSSFFRFMGASLGICSANELYSFCMTHKYCNVSELPLVKLFFKESLEVKAKLLSSSKLIVIYHFFVFIIGLLKGRLVII